MKRTSLLIFASILLSLPASAQASAQASKLALKLLHKADADKDGAVTRQEFKDYRAREFPELDRNRDGVVSADDIPAGIKKRLQRELDQPIGQGEVIAEFDTNKDSQVTLAEFDSGPTMLFDRFDADRNGVITQAEMSHTPH